MIRSLFVASLAMTASAAPASAQRLDGPPSDIRASAAELFEAYGTAISTPRPGAIASFYHVGPVVRTINGVTRRTTRAALDSMYRMRWRPPAFFQFDSLTFDSLSPTQVLVSGRFRWQSAGSKDTVHFLYAGLVEAVDSGMVIRFEHETEAPRRR
jgi:hypothetical protein